MKRMARARGIKRRMKTLVATIAVGLALGSLPEARRSEISSEAILQFAAQPGGPSRTALDAALAGYRRAISLGAATNVRFLTLIDYTLPSVQPRLWVLDTVAGTIAHRELVAHGRGSGENLATSFSNEDDSHKTSLGLFVTGASYVGQNGYSLRLRGLDAGVNDRALARAIVIHGASYVGDAIARQLGRLGRSWGCPAVRPEVARTLIDLIKGGTVVYAHGPRA